MYIYMYVDEFLWFFLQNSEVQCITEATFSIEAKGGRWLGCKYALFIHQKHFMFTKYSKIMWLFSLTERILKDSLLTLLMTL